LDALLPKPPTCPSFSDLPNLLCQRALNPRPTALTRHPVALASNRHAPKDTPIVRQRRQTRASRPCLDRLPPAPKQHRSTIPSRSSNSLDADRRFAAPQLAASAVPEGTHRHPDFGTPSQLAFRTVFRTPSTKPRRVSLSASGPRHFQPVAFFTSF
jgi:hypothetical protein